MKDDQDLTLQKTAEWAHQIRNSLASAILYSEHLQNQGLLHERSSSWLAGIVQSHAQMALQIDAILGLARGEALISKPVNLHDFGTRLEERVHFLAKDKETVIQIMNQLPKIDYCLDEESLIGAVINLVVNALQAQASRISLSLSYEDKQYFRLSIADDGRGMDAASKAQAFAPFFTTKASGTGLGLAVVERVVKAHRGEIWIDSALGKGCVVRIDLPA